MKHSKIELYINGVLQASATPIYPESISIKKEREGGEMFYRTSIDSTLTFLGADYDLIDRANDDSSFEVRIKDAETDTILARGTFEKIDCTFNADDKICSVKVSSADEYDKILKGINDEYDLVSLAPIREKVTLWKRAILQLYVIHDTKLTNIIGNMSYEVNTNSSVEVSTLTRSDLINTYNFSVVNELAAAMMVSSMPSGFSYLVGNYYGEFTGQTSEFIRTSSPYKITIGSSYSSMGNRYYYWQFVNNEGSPIGDGQGRIITSKPSTTIPNPLTNIDFGWSYINNVDVWVADGDMSVYYDERKTFGRIIMDSIPSTPVGVVKEIEPDDIANNNMNYRYCMEVSGISLIGNIISSNEVQSEPTKWGVNGDGDYFVQPQPLHTGDNVIPIGWSRWIPNSLWFNSTSNLATMIDTFSTEWVLRDAYPLWSAIKVLLAKIDDSISFSNNNLYSKFIYGNVPASEIFGWVKCLPYITPITNVKKTYYNQAARKGKITLGQIFEMLRATCQLYWFIDSNKRLRIEHISWFKNGGNYSQSEPLVDLTSVKSPMSMKKWSFGQNTFSYDKSSIVKRYEFGWQSECSEAFDGFPIDINDKYARNGKTNKASASNFISDIDLIMSAPDVLPDDCFALIGTDDSRICKIAEIGNFNMNFVAPTYIMQNPYYSFYYTELAYWTYDLGGYDATTTEYKRASGADGRITVQDTQRLKVQDVQFPIDVNKVGKMGLVRTSLGDGEWVSGEYTPEDGTLQARLILPSFPKFDVRWGDFIIDAGSDMDMLTEKIGDTWRFLIRGHNVGGDDLGYVQIWFTKSADLRITASSEPDTSIGYISESPITDIDDIGDAVISVSGEEDDSFVTFAGGYIYFGYIKSDASPMHDDTILLEIVG